MGRNSINSFFYRFGERRVRACHHPMPVPWPDVPNVLMTRRGEGNSTRKRNIRCNYLFGPFDEGGVWRFFDGLRFDGWTSFVTAVTVPHLNTNISYVVRVSKSLLLVISEALRHDFHSCCVNKIKNFFKVFFKKIYIICLKIILGKIRCHITSGHCKTIIKKIVEKNRSVWWTFSYFTKISYQLEYKTLQLTNMTWYYRRSDI